MDEFSEKCQRGVWAFSIQKFMLQIMGTLIEQGFSIKKLLTNSNFRVKGMFFQQFSERFQTAVDPHPAPQNGPYLWKSCACILYYLAIIPPRIYATIFIIKICNKIFRKWGGGDRRPFGIFSENSSDLVAGPLPKKYMWNITSST